MIFNLLFITVDKLTIFSQSFTTSMVMGVKKKNLHISDIHESKIKSEQKTYLAQNSLNATRKLSFNGKVGR